MALLMVMMILAACSSGSAPAAQNVAYEAAGDAAKAVVLDVEPAAGEAEAPAAEPADEPGAEDTGQLSGEETGLTGQPARTGPVSNRLIVKNAELELTVENTDIAINRSLGIVQEYGGYIISNQTWFNGEGKYASLAIGVPSESFEEMMRRLKDLAVVVTNETASGQDVTDEFVDLESRLRNLEATADRIRDFLKDANDVDKALEVSNKLSEVEQEIEQVKGRMAYLKDRAAFSTITLQLVPQLPTPTPTPEPTPTATPVPWSAGQTFNDASNFATTTAKGLFQVSADLIIWFAIVVLPCLVPIIGLLWLGSRVVQRFQSVK
jgi:hypothetical protein